MKKATVILFLSLAIASCGAEQEEAENHSEPIVETVSTEPYITLNDEPCVIDSITAMRYRILGHPMVETSIYISSTFENSEDTVMVKVEATEKPGRLLFDPPLGDTTSAIITYISRNVSVRSYFRPMFSHDDSKGWIEYTKTYGDTIDIEFEGTIIEATAGSDSDSVITISGSVYGVVPQRVTALGQPIRE